MPKFAIVGYGNLGKSLEREISQTGMLTAIYSRREIRHPLFRPMKELGKTNDFDIALVALGSYADIMQYADALAPFDTVDSFDTHAEIAAYKRRLNEVKRDSLAIISTGWDPGLLSMERALLGLGASQCVTLWGEGVSQGHSNAVRAIPGVIDAVQFTVPKPNAAELIASGITDGRKLHDRICYVACVEADKDDVKSQIVAMPNYFEGYDTEINFVSPQRVRQLKQHTSHCGQVICRGEGFECSCRVSMNNNPTYTAKIMLAYADALPCLKAAGYRGALDVYDIPMKFLADTGKI